MSTHKVEYKHRTILDLTDRKINYQKIQPKLKNLKIRSYNTTGGWLSFIPISNDIKLGKYVISITSSTTALVQELIYDDRLKVSILENRDGHLKSIKLRLLEDQSWFKNYLKNSITINDLVGIISFVDKLDKLYSFS